LAFQITAPIGNIGSFDYEASKSTISNYEAKKKCVLMSFARPEMTAQTLFIALPVDSINQV
jgi:hypothetical protein